jgi:hypothetical protein
LIDSARIDDLGETALETLEALEMSDAIDKLTVVTVDFTIFPVTGRAAFERTKAV